MAGAADSDVAPPPNDTRRKKPGRAAPHRFLRQVQLSAATTSGAWMVHQRPPPGRLVSACEGRGGPPTGPHHDIAPRRQRTGSRIALRRPPPAAAEGSPRRGRGLHIAVSRIGRHESPDRTQVEVDVGAVFAPAPGGRRPASRSTDVVREERFAIRLGVDRTVRAADGVTPATENSAIICLHALAWAQSWRSDDTGGGVAHDSPQPRRSAMRPCAAGTIDGPACDSHRPHASLAPRRHLRQRAAPAGQAGGGLWAA